jgi:hypothetical protein
MHLWRDKKAKISKNYFLKGVLLKKYPNCRKNLYIVMQNKEAYKKQDAKSFKKIIILVNL